MVTSQETRNEEKGVINIPGIHDGEISPSGCLYSMYHLVSVPVRQCPDVEQNTYQQDPDWGQREMYASNPNSAVCPTLTIGQILSHYVSPAKTHDLVFYSGTTFVQE